MIGQFVDATIVASGDGGWLWRPIGIWVLETVLSHLKRPPRLDILGGRLRKVRLYLKIWLKKKTDLVAFIFRDEELLLMMCHEGD